MENEKRLISAEDFKKAFYVDDDCDEIRFGVDGKVFVDFKAVQRAIDEAPTVDAVEVVHAHWVYDGDEVDGNIQAHCSNCFAGDVHATWKKNNIPYCWNCGAKMDGGNEDGVDD